MIVIVAFGPEIGVFRESLFQLPPVLMMILVVISAILTIVAFLSYMPGVFRQFKEYKANKNSDK